MSLDKIDLRYFATGKIENPRFWSRFGGEPSFEGLKVLDVGCGHGSLCVDIASKGAKRVVGVDPNKRKNYPKRDPGPIVEFAKENVLRNYPQFRDIIDFQCCEIADLSEFEFDIILSKSSFEHILGVDAVFAEMKKRLKIGGKMYIGFGPLYNSPYGDHKRTRALLPWGHLIFPEPFLIKRANKYLRNKVASIYELGINKLSLAKYKTIFYNSGLDILYFRVNAGDTLLLKLSSLVRRIPFLEEFFSHNLYCILEKQR